MAYGLRVWGSNGRVLIDGTYPGMVEVMSGTVVTNQKDTYENYPYGYYGTISIPAHYTNYVVAYLPPENEAISYWGNKVYALGTVSIPYKVFVDSSQVGMSSAKYGLRLWNQNNKLIFDSGHTTFNIKASYTSKVPGPSIFHVPEWKYVAPAASNEWIIASSGGIRGWDVHWVTANGLSIFLTIYIRRTLNSYEASYRPFHFMANAISPHDSEMIVSQNISLMRVAIT